MSASRREFLKCAFGTPAVLSLSPTLPAFLTATARAAAKESAGRDTVLVVLQLSGGNDGLNTVVPYADDAYGKNRRTLRLTRNVVHKIGSYLGFHPQMPGFARLFREGHLSVIQGVGYAKSDRSHPGAMRNWHTARPTEANCPTGWIGRTIDSASDPEIPGLTGLFVGPIQQPFALNAEKAVVPSIRSARDLVLRTGQGVQDRIGHLLAGATDAAGDPENPLADFASQNTRAAYATSRQVKTVLSAGAGGAEYPPQQLAGHLKMAAQLIRADVGIRIIFAELGGGGIGGFDNHASQRDNHAALLKQLSDSVTAFIDDLARDGTLQRVALMTFSEFGRTLTENGRRGTGHGAAAPIFVAGGRLRGGLIGKHPSLTDLDQDAPKHHTDFRQVYATLLDTWLGYDSTQVLGKRFDKLDVFDV